jgi:rod shape-determining protein MreD
MIKYLFQHTGNFIGLVLLQVLVLNNIEFSGYVNPYLHILFILALPFETPNWVLLVLAFLLGFIIDLFSNTFGMHTFASVLMAFTRPYLLKVIAPREGYESGSRPGANYFGFEWFIKYSLILVLVHHFSLFYIEAFKFQLFFSTLLRALLSTVFTMILIVLTQLLILKR